MLRLPFSTSGLARDRQTTVSGLRYVRFMVGLGLRVAFHVRTVLLLDEGRVIPAKHWVCFSQRSFSNN